MAPPSHRVPELMDELVEDILLRFLPIDPVSLFRAPLVSKGWCCLISSPGFHRRFEFHQTPPMLGFFCNIGRVPEIYLCEGDLRFMPAAASSFRLPHAAIHSCHALDALHCRVLFYDFHDTATSQPMDLIVWNPRMGEVCKLLPPMVPPYMFEWNVALLCAAAGCDDHVGCGSTSYAAF
ncbi:unnamed protein product [Urochloa humidicola]